MKLKFRYETPCIECLHYNEGKGEVCCDWCDPPFDDCFEYKGDCENEVEQESIE